MSIILIINSQAKQFNGGGGGGGERELMDRQTDKLIPIPSPNLKPQLCYNIAVATVQYLGGGGRASWFQFHPPISNPISVIILL